MTIYTAKGKSYEYVQINDIPADKSCVGMIVRTLCWGKAIIVKYKNAKSIDVLFLDSGNVETVQKAALEVGNVADGVAREFLNAKAKDEYIVETCRKQILKLQAKAKKAVRRIKSRDNNRKERIKRSFDLYKLKENRINEQISENTGSD